MPLKRRRFLALGGVALLAGCVGDEPDDSATTDPGASPGTDGDGSDGGDSGDGSDGGDAPALSDDVAAAFDAVPETVGDRTLNTFWVFNPETDDEGSVYNSGDLSDTLGVPEDAVDRAVTAIVSDAPSQTLAVVVGSFDADDVDVADEQTSDTAVHVADGLAILAAGDDGGWQAALDAAVEAADDPETGVTEEVAPVVAPLQDGPFVVVSTAPSEDQYSAWSDRDDLDAIAFMRQRIDDRRRRQEYAVQFTDENDATTGAAETVIAGAETTVDFEEVDIEYEQYDRTVVGSFTAPLPPSQLPDDSPDVRFTVTESDEPGEITVIVRGEESVDPANLEFRVDGEARTPPWDGRETPLDPGDEFTADVETFRTVSIWWLDPERDGVEQPLARQVVARDVFTSEYDSEADVLTITYTGDRTVATDRFEVSVNPVGNPQDDSQRPLSAITGDELAPDDQFEIEDVQPGDGVSILVTGKGDGAAYAQSVFATAVSPPGEFTIETGEGQATVTFEGDERPADAYRVLVDDSPADVQFADEYDTLTDGDRITVDAEFGDRIVVKWTERDAVPPLASEVVTPEAEFDASYDAETDELTVTYAEGDALDADKLGVVGPGLRNREAWREAYDTVEPGDAITLTVDSRPREVLVVFDQSALLDRIKLS